MKLHLQYFSFFCDLCGKSSESLDSSAQNANELYKEIQEKYKFNRDPKNFRVAINDEFSEWDTPLNNGDTIVFIPPVAGG